MIVYYKGAFGLNLLLRFHGSAVYRALLPGLFSVGIYLLINLYFRDSKYDENDDDELLNHPYAIGVFVSAVAFLIVFRANFGYQRYWEACTSTFNMMSKWMDATTHTSVFHLQCDHYQRIKPPSFYDYPDLNDRLYTRDREKLSHNYDVNADSTTTSTLRRRKVKSSSSTTTDIFDDDNRCSSTAAGYDGSCKSLRVKHTPSERLKYAQHLADRSNVKSIHASHQQQQAKNKPRLHFSDDVKMNGQDFHIHDNEHIHDNNNHRREVFSCDPIPLIGPTRLDGGWKGLYSNKETATFYKEKKSKQQQEQREESSPRRQESSLEEEDDDDGDNMGFASHAGGRMPPLFLQELAHLSSLMNAVALSTLRNDIEEASSPLDIYNPSSTPPWPEVDPGKILTTSTQRTIIKQQRKRNNNNKEQQNKNDGRTTSNQQQKQEGEQEERSSIQEKIKGLLLTIKLSIYYFLGIDRTPEKRTIYNMSRPLPVIGGVSDGEIYFLQMAKGPAAKTQLVFNWLTEFIVREHLSGGSLGDTGSPIISRVMQFLGDGMLAYNTSRKIMFIPFPFPHAQLSVLAIFFVTFAVPFMLDQYTNETWLGAILSFLTITTLAGMHEVARELENPFRNMPNEIPLVTLQAMYNETLITMFAGYHPDSYWDPNNKLSKHNRSTSKHSNSNNSNMRTEVGNDDTSTEATIFADENDSFTQQQHEQQQPPSSSSSKNTMMSRLLDVDDEDDDADMTQPTKLTSSLSLSSSSPMTTMSSSLILQQQKTASSPTALSNDKDDNTNNTNVAKCKILSPSSFRTALQFVKNDTITDDHQDNNSNNDDEDETTETKRINELQNLVENQTKQLLESQIEIERLRLLVESRLTSATIGENDNKP